MTHQNISSPTPSKEELIGAAQKHYNSSNNFLFAASPTAEDDRRQALWTGWTKDMSSWRAFRATLKRAVPDHIIGETYSSADGGPRCIIYPPKESRAPSSNWLVVGCVSLLAPVYFVYGAECDYSEGSLRNIRASIDQLPPDVSILAQVIAQAIEASFGFSAVSREVARTPVPLFTGRMQPPHATLFHALFTSAPNSIP